MFKRHAFLLGAITGTLAAALCSLAPVLAQEASDADLIPPPSLQSDGGILVERCFVRFINKTKVPAEAAGKLTDLRIEEGMLVNKGDVIAVIDSQQSEFTLELKKREEVVAKLNAHNDVNKRDAVQTEKIARAQAETYKSLHEKGAAPYWEMREKVAEADRAILRIELAETNEKTAMAEYLAKQFETRIAELDIQMRTIRAEFGGFVETRFAQLGEWVQPGTPIIELVQMDRVRVEGFINAINYAGRVKRGTPVQITVTVGGSSTAPVTRSFTAKIEYVSTELDLNGRHRIWASIPNEADGDDWLLKPGMRATMKLLPGTAAF